MVPESSPMFAALGEARLRDLLRPLAVAALLALPLAVFFAPTLIAGNAPGGFDLSFQSSPWRDEARRPLDAQSPVQIDQAEQLPWVDGMWETLRDGRVPMWTPAVGGGTSLGTNPVFTTYSVFTIVGQLVGGVTSLAIGLAVRIVLATAVAELFAYLFLRRVGLRPGAAVFGTVAYVFSGAAIAFETRNAIPLLLPVALWCTDRLAERVSPTRIVAFAGAVLALWLEGFPAMLVHVVVVCGAWWFVRTAAHHGWRFWRRAELGRWTAAAAGFGGGLVLGGLLSAVSAVPFALQLGYNDVFAARADEASPLGSVSAWWLLDERGLGQPDRGPWFIALNPFEGVAAVGTLVMAAAVLGLVAGACRRRRDAADAGADAVRNFWGVTVAILVVAVYLGGPLLDALYALPGFTGNPFSRIRFVLAFGLAVLAALGLQEAEGWWRHRSGAEDAVSWSARLPHVAVAGAVLAAVASPFVDSFGAYVDVARSFRDEAVGAWRSELLALGVATVLVAVALVATRKVPERWALARGLALGGIAAAAAFTQVGLQLTRLTPQVDRAFYYPATAGYDALREVTADRSRFIGSGMGTFAPNTAMTNDVVDARSHSFRDPQWKALILAVFPDALGPDPLKINVDFHGNVVWDSPLFDDMALGVLAMSSSEVPLGDRIGAPEAGAWETVVGDGAVVGDGPTGPFVGIDLRLRADGDCAQGDVVVAAGDGAVARRPLGDVRAAAAAQVSLPFALPLDDAAADDRSRLTVSLDGAPPDCRLGVGVTDPTAVELTHAPITRPADADWELVSADGGWLYRRPSAHPLVRLVGEWTPAPSRDAALQAAIDPARSADDPMPVAFAATPEPSSTDGVVRSWSADDHGLSAEVASDGPTMLVTAFNHAPGWTVTVDGRAADIVEPDGAFLGVQLPAGDHDVRFEYRPPGLVAGAALSLVGVLGCVVVLMWPRWGTAVTRRFRRDASAGGSPGTPAGVAPD